MKPSLLFTFPLTLTASVFASQTDDFAHGQQPIIADDCTTRTTTVTRTSYEVNVVSTVYRTRGNHYEARPTPEANREPTEQNLVFGVTGRGCNSQACEICRMLNNCSDEEWDCMGCDLAFYCKECPAFSNRKIWPAGMEEMHIKKTCSLGPGRSVPCDNVDELIANRHKVSRFGE